MNGERYYYLFTLILEDIIGLWIGEKSLFTEKPSKDSHIAKKWFDYE